MTRAGFQPPLFPLDGERAEVPAVNTWFQKSERVWDSAHVHLQQAVRRHKDVTDVCCLPTPHYQPGDLVWLTTKDIRLRLPCRKLSPCFISPFPIRRQINYVSYQLQLPAQYRIAPTFHVSLLKPYTNPTIPLPAESDVPDESPSPDLDEEPIY